jgi:hypothetical protein
VADPFLQAVTTAGRSAELYAHRARTKYRSGYSGVRNLFLGQPVDSTVLHGPSSQRLCAGTNGFAETPCKGMPSLGDRCLNRQLDACGWGERRADQHPEQ